VGDVEAQQPSAARVTFGHVLRQLRERRELSQGKLATLANISPAMVSQLELGKRGASPPVLAALAQALGVDPRTLSAEHFAASLQHSSHVHPRKPAYFIDNNLLLLSREQDDRLDRPGEDEPPRVFLSGDAMDVAQVLEALRRLTREPTREPSNRMDLVAQLIDSLNGLSSAELMKVIGFVQGLKAARDRPDPQTFIRSLLNRLGDTPISELVTADPPYETTGSAED
jgi:transcriptional regulator with XRE-family HTH domain